MKIERIELFPVKPRWMFLKMYTDQDIVGYGEPTLEGHLKAVAGHIEELKSYLIGKDPRRIEHHWQAIYRGNFYRGGPVFASVLSGLEQAMWDIKGKWLGVPVYELLGGACRDKIKVYGHVHGKGDNLRKGLSGSELKAVKTGLEGPVETVAPPEVINRAAEKVGALRERLGDGVDIGVDFHGRYSPAMAIRIARALEPYQPMFIEEPCLPENVEAMVRINESTPLTVATGERLFTKWQFRELLSKQAADIVQPDLSHAGGILECKKIAAMAETNYAAVAPHCPLGPVALAACLQLDACIPNFLIQEQVTLGEEYLTEPFTIRDGYIPLPEGPGLGIELDDEALEEGKLEEQWDNPRLYHEDGAVADW